MMSPRLKAETMKYAKRHVVRFAAVKLPLSFKYRRGLNYIRLAWLVNRKLNFDYGSQNTFSTNQASSPPNYTPPPSTLQALSRRTLENQRMLLIETGWQYDRSTADTSEADLSLLAPRDLFKKSSRHNRSTTARFP